MSTLHRTTVSLALHGDGLGAVWGTQKTKELLNEAGFSQIAVQSVEGDIFNAYSRRNRDIFTIRKLLRRNPRTAL